MFLDYDGTLTPVRARPQDAVLADDTRQLIRRLAERCFVAVVTGRGLADVQAQVDLPSIVYAANHGLEISGPAIAFEVDPSLRATFAALRPEVDALVEGIEGVVVEHKGFSIAIHFRLAPPDRVDALLAGVDAIEAAHPTLRKGTGKKVVELRPALDWHKGAAVRWLCEQLAARGPRPRPLMLGDDRTDEDALQVVREDGVGIFVGQPQWITAAHYSLRDPAAVAQLLERLVAWV
ncbi:MAG: trehalose-phosphatase [Deltaproteobacteria bacterium]|nr:trehalose-phosphatase [Deltaproteobacteria bacterium]